jgi:hypothetical protein
VDRTEALEEIARLARQHALTGADIVAALDASAPATRPATRSGVLVRVLGFLGGTFVFAGIGIFVAMQWDTMNSAARVVVTLGSGIAVFALGLLASRDPRFEKAATPLLLVAAAVEPTGMFVAFDEYGSGGDWHWASLVTAAAMALQFGAVFGVLRRSMTLFVAVSFAIAGLWTALDLMHLRSKTQALVAGTTTLLVAVGVGRTRHHDVTPLWYLVGTLAALIGLFALVKSSPAEVLYLAAAAGLVYLSVVVRSRTLLVSATLGILAYSGWFTSEYFADSIGWPLALIAFGIFMIGLSGLAYRLDRDYVRQSRA